MCKLISGLIVVVGLLFLTFTPVNISLGATPRPASGPVYAPAVQYVVSTRADAGPGSLRAILGIARQGDLLTFDPAVFPPTQPATITLLSPLPPLTQGDMTLDASNAGVIVDGSQVPAGGDGLQIISDGNVVRGLQIIGFPANGISIKGGSGNVIGGSWQTGAARRGQGNILTRNGADGLRIEGGANNTVVGNLVGLDWDGTLDLRVQTIAISPDFAADQTMFIGTRFHGVWRSTDGGSNWQEANLGLTAANVLSLAISPDYRVDHTLFAGTVEGGVFKSESGGSNWIQVSGKRIPLDIIGLAISPNYANDQFVVAATNARHQVAYVSHDGGVHWEPPDQITANWESLGIAISPDFASDNTLFDFSWGAIAKSTDRGQSWEALNDAITAISGLVISPAYPTDNTVFVLGDCGGVGVCRSNDGGEHWQRVGGDPDWEWSHLTIVPDYPGERTLFVAESQGIFRSTDGGVNWQKMISVDRSRALAVSPAFAQDRQVFAEHTVGDLLRSGDAGASWQPIASLSEKGNAGCGVRVLGGATHTVIGSDVTGAQNVISKNRSGVCISDAATTGTQVKGNYVGADAQGLQPAGNLYEGIAIFNGARANHIGGESAGRRNVISANQRSGVVIWNEGTDGNTISGNYIGVNATGETAMGNDAAGVALDRASNNKIGGENAAERNIISANGWNGVHMIGGGENEIVGNYIGTDASGTIAFGNHESGINLEAGAHDNRIEHNLLSGNRDAGLDFLSSGTFGNIVIANVIGVNASATAALGNDWGIGCWGSGYYHVIRDNTIAGNASTGINWLNCHHATVADNRIGVGAYDVPDLGNGESGVDVWGGASQNTIGPGNIIAHNRIEGLRVLDSDTLGNRITGNAIHHNGGLGIDNMAGGNKELSPPTITSVTTTMVSGAALAGVRIEVFSDEDGQGAMYEGGTMSTAGGSFSFTKPGGLHGPYLTAVAIDAIGDTSEFSLRGGPIPAPTITPTPTPSECNGPRWSVLIYLNGDNNLDFWTFNLFNRLEMAADNPCVQIVVLWDRSGVGDTVLYWVQHDESPYDLAAYTDHLNRWPRGELNMGDPQTLINFVTQARQDFPNPHTFLAMVDHGNGWSPSLPVGKGYPHGGMSFDDGSGGAYLSTTNLETAFGVITNDGDQPIDVVYFDACLMSMIENAYPLRRFIHYLVASQNETFSSYPYDQYLDNITGATQPADLAKNFVDRYHESLQGYPRTMVALDLTYMSELSQTVDGLARMLIQQVHVYESQLVTSFESSQKFDSNLDLRLDDTDAYIDLYHFAQMVKLNVPEATTQAAAQRVMDAIGEPGARLILRERHASGVYWGNGEPWGLDNAHGFSIYLPLGEDDWLLAYYNPKELSFAADTAWDDLLREMIEIPQSPPPTPIEPADRPGPLPVLRIYLPLMTQK